MAAELKVKSGGTWRTITAPEVKSGGVWRTIKSIEVKSGGVWRSVYASGPSVSPNGAGDYNSRYNNWCYAGLQWNANGTEYVYTATGGTTSRGVWLDSGLNSEVWVEWTRTGGTLGDWDSLGAGNNGVRLQCSTTRSFRLVDSQGVGNASETIIGKWEMWDAASGGNLLWSNTNNTYEAWYEYEACPLCCFTPNTRVMLASGLEVPISSVRKGDMIQCAEGIEAVKNIITRVNRRMFRIQFEDGRFIEASDDHPFEVKDKGAASIAHWEEVYKELAPRAELQIGDQVSTAENGYAKIIGIREIDYPGTVYTFENSLFYANGLLVY